MGCTDPLKRGCVGSATISVLSGSVASYPGHIYADVPLHITMAHITTGGISVGIKTCLVQSGAHQARQQPRFPDDMASWTAPSVAYLVPKAERSGAAAAVTAEPEPTTPHGWQSLKEKAAFGAAWAEAGSRSTAMARKSSKSDQDAETAVNINHPASNADEQSAWGAAGTMSTERSRAAPASDKGASQRNGNGGGEGRDGACAAAPSLDATVTIARYRDGDNGNVNGGNAVGTEDDGATSL